MLYRRNIVIDLNYNDALSKIEKLSSNYPYHKKSAGEFVIIRSVAYRHKRGIFTYCFSGKLVKDNSQVLLNYKVNTSLSVRISAFFLCIPLILGIENLCTRPASVTFTLVGLLINVLFWVFVFGQAYNCIEQFEKLFRVQN